MFGASSADTREVSATPSGLSETLRELDRRWEKQINHKHISKHSINLINDEARPFHSVLYRASPRARKFDAAEIDRVLGQGFMNPATT